jgi:hypothetical protein
LVSLGEAFEKNREAGLSFQYPSDGIKSAREIAYNV